MEPTSPISVVIPAWNSAPTLDRVLEAISRSGRPPLEVIVADDCSTDNTAQVAEHWGAVLIRTPRRSGPATARNLAASAARGSILLFLDSDVLVQPDTIAHIEAAFEDPTLDALIGSYDDEPEDYDFLSQYKNLMHCYMHQRGKSEASTFWSGCGAIRKHVFEAQRGFDESFTRPAIEDIELGYRLKSQGRRILLDHDLRVKHLKKWTFWGLVKSDVLDRGIPWTELILRDRRMPNDLNLQLSQRVSVALVFLMMAMAGACALYWKGYFLTPLFALIFFLLGRYWIQESAETSVSTMATMTAAALLLIWLAWSHQMKGLIPFVLLSLPGLVLRHRYQPGAGYALMRVAHWVYFALGLAVIIGYFPDDPLLLSVAAPLFLVLFVNRQFYVFLAARRGKWFALAAIPFHLLYHLYNGISFITGILHFAWRKAAARRQMAPHRRPGS